nr:hypothetical protein [Tanacetum cinerariifolium]
MNSLTFVDVLNNVFRLFEGERGDIHCSGYLFGTIPTDIPATVPVVDPPVVYDDTSLIPTKTPTIPPVVPTLPHTLSFLSGYSFCRPYRTYPNGLRKMLTARKRVRALPPGRLPSRTHFEGVTDWYREPRLFEGERGDIHCSGYLFGTIPTNIPATVPVVDPPVTVAQWRSKVAARSSPPSSPTHDLPAAVRHIVPAPHGVPHRPAILVLPARKRVRALPPGRLASRTMPTTTRSGMTPAVINEMIERRVTESLKAYEANRNREPTMEAGRNMMMITRMTMETIMEMEET